MNVTDCLARSPGETCTLRCIDGYAGEAAVYTCLDSEVFEGTPPICVPTTTTTFSITSTSSTTTATTTKTTLVLCVDGIPSGIGVEASNCFELYNGQSCNASCIAPFEPITYEYVCDPLTASLTGPELICKLKECEVSQLPSNLSTSDCEGKVVGEFCSLSCLAGYTGQEELQECTESGAFAGSWPQCEPLPCSIGNLPVLPGVDISNCLNLFAGGNCSVTCDVGYEGTVSSFLCDLTGSFTGNAPSCSPKRCVLPDYLQGNSSFNASTCNGLTHGQTCLSECSVGYSGLPSQHLCNDGTLEGSAPSCTPEACTFEGVLGIALDSSACSGKVSGETCQLQCSQGYDLAGDASLTCQAETSTFTSSSAVCEPAKCGNLSSTVSTFASAGVGETCSSLVFGQGCFAFCQQGYLQQGNALQLLCADVSTSAGYVEILEGGGQQDAVNSSGPTCTAQPCTAGVPNIRGATHDCDGKVTGETCTISAELGFTISGTTTLTCQADGSFTQDLPTLEPAVCADPGFGTGILSTCENKALDAYCWAYCDQAAGYTGSSKEYRCQANTAANAVQIEPVGDAITCTSTGGGRRLQTASCLESSAATVGLSPTSFTHDCSGKVHNDACIAHCSLGWNMTETTPSIYSCQNGALVGGSLPTCTPLPCTFAFPNGLGVLHTCDGVRTAQTCVASCTEVGFDYSAGQVAATYTCLSTGSLSGTAPTCERISCSDLQLDSQYLHTCQGRRYQDTCEVSCGQGYSLSGSSSQRECQADGSFSGGLPSCVGNPCDQSLPNNPTVNSSSCTGLVTAQSCEVTCADGFLPGNATLTCDASGYILGTMPSCKPMTCPDAAWAAEYRSTCSGTTYGSKCAVFCAPGYSSTGTAVEEWQCGWVNGQVQLQGNLPTCEAQACTSGLPANGTSITSNCSTVKTGETCQQTCAFGYTYSTNATASVWTCQEDGSASGSSTACQAIACDTALSVTGVDNTCNGIVFGASCFAFCGAGYESASTVKSQRLQCAGSSAGALITGLTETDGVALRGQLPTCNALPCLYNLPVGNQYDHNCSNVTTGESCVVNCASSFFGIPVVRQCLSSRLLEGGLPTCSFTSTTMTSTTTSRSTQTISMTTTVTTLPFFCTDDLIPWVQGAGNFTCFGEPGVGQRCSAPCVEGPDAVVVCWTSRRWQLQEICHNPEPSPLVPIFVVTLSIMCALVLCLGGGLYCVLKTPKTVPIEADLPEGVKTPTSPVSETGRITPKRVLEMPGGATYAWMHDVRRPVHPLDMEIAMETILQAQYWQQPNQPPALPPAPLTAPPGSQQSLSCIALDEMFAGADPPLVNAYRRPPIPETVVQVDDDPSFRVWVQHVPVEGTSMVQHFDAQGSSP